MDHFSYSGVLGEGASGKWDVLFEDGNRKQVAEHHILPLSALREGQTVQVLEDDGYTFAVITKILP